MKMELQLLHPQEIRPGWSPRLLFWMSPFALSSHLSKKVKLTHHVLGEKKQVEVYKSLEGA